MKDFFNYSYIFKIYWVIAIRLKFGSGVYNSRTFIYFIFCDGVLSLIFTQKTNLLKNTHMTQGRKIERKTKQIHVYGC